MKQILSMNSDYSPFGAPLADRKYTTLDSRSNVTVAYDRFETGADGWGNSAGSSMSIISADFYYRKRLQITASGTSFQSAEKTYHTIAGKRYKLSFYVRLDGVFVFPYAIVGNSIELYRKTETVSNMQVVYFTANTTGTTLKFEMPAGPIGRVARINDVLLEEVYEDGEYRFGFNGKELDNETYGTGNAYDFGARIYDPRLAKWLSVDPSQQKYPGISPYNYSYNSPVIFNDPDGKDARLTIVPNSNGGGTITMETTVHLYGKDAETLSKTLTAYSASGNVKIDGKEWTVKVNVNYVVNKQLDAAVSAMNLPNGEHPDASSLVGKANVQAGDNILLVDKSSTPHPAFPNAAGRTKHGNSAKMKTTERADGLHESLTHFFGMDERYTPSTDEMPFPTNDPGFESDVSGSGGTDYSPVHLYDLAEYATQVYKGTINSQPIKFGKVGATTTTRKQEDIGGHKPESEADVKKKSDATTNVEVKKN